MNFMENWTPLVQLLTPLEGHRIAALGEQDPSILYNMNSVCWRHYYPEEHFPTKDLHRIVLDLCLLDTSQSWVTRVDPGSMAPWQHEVVEPDLTRYTVILQDMTPGQVVCIGPDTYSKLVAGKVILWNDVNYHRLIMNGGYKPIWCLDLIGHRQFLPFVETPKKKK
jgi:hypothetical protein